MSKRPGGIEKRKTEAEKNEESDDSSDEEDVRPQRNLNSPLECQASETPVKVEVTQGAIEVDKATYIANQKAQWEQTTKYMQKLQLEGQADVVNVEQTNKVKQPSADRKTLQGKNETRPKPQAPSSVTSISTSRPKSPTSAQPQQISEGFVVDDQGTLRMAFPQYDRKLQIPEHLMISDCFEQAQTICNDLLRLSQNHPKRVQELQKIQETFDSQQVTPRGLTRSEYEIIANLFHKLIGAHHHCTPAELLTITTMLNSYLINGPESLTDISDCVDVSASHFESFRNDLVNFSESHLTRMDRVVEQVLQGLCTTDKNLNMERGCLRPLVQFESAGGFGYFLASYSKGKLSKMLKSAIFDKSFYDKFVCPGVVGGKEMSEAQRSEAEQLMRVLLDHLLRVQVLLNNSDIKKCLAESRLEVPIQISVARLSIPKTDDDGKAQRLFNGSFQSNNDVKAAFLLASGSPITSTPKNISYQDQLREALTTVASKGTRNGILDRFYAGDTVTVDGAHERVGVVIKVDLQNEELVVALPSEAFWRGSPQDVHSSLEHSQLPIPGSIVSFTQGERVTKHGLADGYGVFESIADCEKGEIKACSIRAFSINSENVEETVEADYSHINKIDEQTRQSIWTVEKIENDPRHFTVGDYIAICSKADGDGGGGLKSSTEEINEYLKVDVDKTMIRVKVSEYGRVVERLTRDEKVRIEVFRLPNVRIDISWHNVRRVEEREAKEFQKHYEKIYADICLLGNYVS